MKKTTEVFFKFEKIVSSGIAIVTIIQVVLLIIHLHKDAISPTNLIFFMEFLGIIFVCQVLNNLLLLNQLKADLIELSNEMKHLTIKVDLLIQQR